MGTILALPCMAVSAFCCCCQSISCVCSTANMLSCCCRSAMGKRTGISPRLAKIFYIILLGAAAVMAIIMRFNATNLDLGALSVSCSGGNTSVTVYGFSEGTYVYCKGDAAVYRICFVMSVFFALLIVLSMISERFHRGFWFIKIVLLCGAMVGVFFMNEASFDKDAYAWVARIGSIFFLVLQILVLIDFAYQWNESWVDRAYSDPINVDLLTNKKWLWGILVSAGVLYAGAVAGIALLFVFYAKCEIGKAFTALTIIAIVAVTVISLFRDRIVGEAGAILPAAVVVAYSVFLCWSSLESNPDASCRPFDSQTAASIAIGATWATITLLWTTFSVTSNAGHLVKGEELDKAEEVQQKEGGMAVADNKDETATSGTTVKQPKKKNKKQSQRAGGPILQDDLEEQAAPPPPKASVNANNNNNEEGEEDDSPVYSTEKPWTFHLIMLSASFYVAMLLTDWGNFSSTQLNITAGNASMWVKISAQWLTILLFLWTLVAPAVLTGREF